MTKLLGKMHVAVLLKRGVPRGLSQSKQEIRYLPPLMKPVRCGLVLSILQIYPAPNPSDWYDMMVLDDSPLSYPLYRHCQSEVHIKHRSSKAAVCLLQPSALPSREEKSCQGHSVS
jgi:hypothetical protein